MAETTKPLAFPAGLLATSSETGRSKPLPSRKLDAVYQKHAPGLGRLAYLLTGDATVAEDLVQEAFVRAYARLGYLRRQDALAAYLRRTVVNLAHKHARRDRAERAYLQANRGAPDVVSQPDLALREELWRALRELPARQRSALVLRFYEDLSEKEAAQLLGCRVGTVKSLVHRALCSMREQIGGEYE